MGRLYPQRAFKKDQVMPLAQKQRHLDEVACPSFCAGRKLGEAEQALLWNLLQEDLACPRRVLLDRAAHKQVVLPVSLRDRLTWRRITGSTIWLYAALSSNTRL